MTPTVFLNGLPPDRKKTLAAIRKLILTYDNSVTESVGEMMGKEMLIYKAGDIFKYALASTKGYMSFHSMVMYGCAPHLREKYITLLKKAKFQKGCINFKTADEMPLDIAEQFIKESAAIPFPPQWYFDRIKKKPKP